MRRRALALLAATLIAACAPSPAPAPADPLDAVRAGGHVIYVRHATTDTASEPRILDLDDCSWQRNLTAEGRREAQSLGERIRALRLPIATVETSAYCRTRETARLAFGDHVESAWLFYHANQPPEEFAAGVAGLRRKLSTPLPAGGNVVLVGHAPAIREAAGALLGEAEALIVRPLGDGRFARIGLLDERGFRPFPAEPPTGR